MVKLTAKEKEYEVAKKLYKRGIINKKPLPPPPSKDFDQKKMAKLLPFGKRIKGKKRRKRK